MDCFPVTIATCPACKLLLGVTVMNPKHLKDTAKFIKNWAKAGLFLRTYEVGDRSWEPLAMCKCPSWRKPAPRSAV